MNRKKHRYRTISHALPKAISPVSHIAQEMIYNVSLNWENGIHNLQLSISPREAVTPLMVAHFVKTEKSAKLRATFLLFRCYSFCLCPAVPVSKYTSAGV